MVASKKISPNRRRSSASINQNIPSLVPKGRRRAHSIVPGVLSPTAKARRSLAPRKSILKASINALNVDDSDNPAAMPQASAEDDGTQSYDTKDYTASRKSLGRRVSFALTSHVVIIPPHAKNSEASQSSLEAISSRPSLNSNENADPRKLSSRSSSRFSLAGSEDMDLTTIVSNSDLGSAIIDEELDYDDEESDALEITDVVNGDFHRKRSLSNGGRKPLAELKTSPEPADQSYESISEGSSIRSDSHSQVMEFTIPLGQSLRPAQEDPVWLALKQMAGSGGPSASESSPEGYETEGMNLEDAMARLKRARASFSQPDEEGISFSSTDDSYDEESDEDKTMNFSQVLGRASLASNSRMSMGYQDSNMDESEVYGTIAVPLPTSSQSETQSLKESQIGTFPTQPPRSFTVFQPPPSESPPKPIVASQTSKSTTISFIPRASSPSKLIPTGPKPSFTAAFAPPVQKPSPKKPNFPSDSRSPAIKRPFSLQPDDGAIDIDKPSPAKRQALAGKWLDAAETREELPAPLVKPGSSKPKPLSPNKKAPFQTFGNDEQISRTSSALRRPSGYFARRKSLAAGLAQASSTIEEEAPAINLASQKKAIVSGRASLGSAPSHTSLRFNKLPRPPSPNKASIVTKNAKVNEANNNGREATRQVSDSPIATRGSPAQDLPSRPDQHIDVPYAEPNEESGPTDAGELSQNMEVDIDATRQWREGIQHPENQDDEEVPSISIGQFFSMTGIKFMDELTAPRRSVHPSQQPIRQPRNPTDILLSEYFTAIAIDIPQLDLYSRVSKDLEGWMAKSKIVFAQAEEEAAKVTPELFVEYARADEEGQAELLHQLNLIRTHTRYLAKSDWYDWKLQWVEGLRHTAEKAFSLLENDARTLERPKKHALELIPELEKEYEALKLELEQEQAEVSEIEASDQDYLNELKATIAEQNIEIEALKAELSEGNEQLRWLTERMEEIELGKRKESIIINEAQRRLHLKQTSTLSEVFRLKGELEAFEDLHMFRITKVNSDLFEYRYASLFYVSIPCRNFMPIVSKVTITKVEKQNARYKDDFPRLSSFLLNTAKQLIRDGDPLAVRDIVLRLSDYWSSCAQLRSQLTLLSIKFPVEIVIPSSDKTSMPHFKVKTTVILPSVMAKAFIFFVFSLDTFRQWPMSISSLDCEVEIAYGSVQGSSILEAVTRRISEATPWDNYACLLDACIEAQDRYH